MINITKISLYFLVLPLTYMLEILITLSRNFRYIRVRLSEIRQEVTYPNSQNPYRGTFSNQQLISRRII